MKNVNNGLEVLRTNFKDRVKCLFFVLIFLIGFSSVLHANSGVCGCFPDGNGSNIFLCNLCEDFTIIMVGPYLKVYKSISNDTPMQGDVVTFTLLVENTGNLTAYDVIVIDELESGFDYVDGSLKVYSCNKTDNITEECITYKEYGCYSTGCYLDYDNSINFYIIDNKLIWDFYYLYGYREYVYNSTTGTYSPIEMYPKNWVIIQFNVSVGENVTPGNYTNTANVSGYFDDLREYLIDYSNESPAGCGFDNYNETTYSCINTSLANGDADDKDRTSSVTFTVLPEQDLSFETVKNKIASRLDQQVILKLEYKELKNKSDNQPGNMSLKEELDRVYNALIGTCAQLTNLSFQEIYLYFAYKPTPTQLETLETLGVSVNTNYWIPPMPSEGYPYGFHSAVIHIEGLYDLYGLTELDFVKYIDTAEICIISSFTYNIMPGIEIPAVGPYIEIHKFISNATIRQDDTIMFTLLVGNTGNATAFNVTTRDKLETGFSYINGSEQVYYCSEINNSTNECIDYTYYNKTGYNFNNSNNSRLEWGFESLEDADKYPKNWIIIQFNVSVGENVTPGSHTNTANVSGYHGDLIHLINYENDTWEGCGGKDNYNETTHSCINTSIANGDADDKDRTSSVTFTVLPVPDLTISKDSLTPYRYPKATSIYEITITNNGNETIENVTINDVSPFNQTAGPYPIGGECVGGNIRCLDNNCSGKNETFVIAMPNGDEGMMLPGQSCTFEYESLIPWNTPDGMYENTAEVKVNNIKVAEDEAFITCVSPPGIIAQKTANTTTGYIGDYVNFTINLSARWSSINITDVYLTDIMPFGWEFISSAGAELINCTGRICNFKLNNNLTDNITTVWIETRVNETASFGFTRNKVEIEGNGTDGLNVHGYTFSNVIDVQQKPEPPRLEVIKSMSWHDVEPGSEPITTIIIENKNNISIYNLTITDFLPLGFNYTKGTVMINGRQISEPFIQGNQSDFPCEYDPICNTSRGTKAGLNLTWNWTNTKFKDNNESALLEIPAKTIIVLTFKTEVKCNVCNNTFNNTVEVSGFGSSGLKTTANASFEMEGEIKNAALFKYPSDNSPEYYEYVDYTIVIWNDPDMANIIPLILKDELPPYIKYVPGYDITGDLRWKPTVCGDYKDKEFVGDIQKGTEIGNCSELNYTESTGDGIGQTLYWTFPLFFCPWNQRAVKYRTQVLPGVSSIAINHANLSYLDPNDECSDCVFYLHTSAAVGVIGDETPDLTITNLTVPTEATEGSNITISALIKNLQNINLNLSIVNVSLFINDIYKNSKTLNLTDKFNETVNFTWLAEQGTHKVTIKIDPNNEIPESNETNNGLSQNLSVKQKIVTKSRKSTGGGGGGSISAAAFKKMCGNALCEENETCGNCPGDCGNCSVEIEPENESKIKPILPTCQDSCGDNNTCTRDFCSEKTNYTCKHAPIIPCCGNGVCEKEENCTSCPGDCGKCKLNFNCETEAIAGETVECLITDNKNNPLPNATVKITTGNNTITKTTDENGIISFIPETSGILDMAFEKSGYVSETIDISVITKPEEKTFFDLIIKIKFELLILILIIMVLLWAFIKKKGRRKTALESIWGR